MRPDQSFPASHDREVDEPFLELACEHPNMVLVALDVDPKTAIKTRRFACEDCGLRFER